MQSYWAMSQFAADWLDGKSAPQAMDILSPVVGTLVAFHGQS